MHAIEAKAGRALWPGIRAIGVFLLPIFAALALVLLIPGQGDKPLPPSASPTGLSSAPGPVRDERYLWRPVAIGGGGYITGLAVDASGQRLLARSDVHGAYVWSRPLDRWVQLATSASMPEELASSRGAVHGAYEIAVAPGDPERLYLAISGQVFRSDNGGARFESVTKATPFPLSWDANSAFRFNGPFMAVSPKDSDRLFLGTPGDGLWRTGDGGRTWTKVTEVPPSADLRPGEPGMQTAGIAIWFAPAPSTAVYAAVPGRGLYAAPSADAAFAPLAAGAGPLIISRGEFTHDGSFIALDREAGRAWILRANQWHALTGPSLPSAAFAGVAVEPGGKRVIITDQGGKAWCSSDQGETWVGMNRVVAPSDREPPWLARLHTGFFASGQIQFDPVVHGRLWVGAGTGVYRADLADGCAEQITWRSQVRGIEELVAEDVIQRPGRAPLFAALDFGIHIKRDLNSFSTTYGPKARDLIAAQKLDWSPADPLFVVTNASDTRLGCCSEDGDAVLAGFSVDGGDHWQKFPTLPVPPGTLASDPHAMAFGTIAVAADSTSNIVWVPARNRSPFYTRDRGATWQRVVLPGEHLPLTGSFDSLWLPRRTLAADRVLPGTFYMVHSGNPTNPGLKGLWRTQDGGAHWSRVFTGDIAPDSQYAAKLRSVPGKAGHLFFTASVASSSDSRLRRSIDGGASWTIVVDVDRVDDVAFGKAAPGSQYPTIFISGRVSGAPGIWRSVDNAAHWQRIADLPLGRLDQVNVLEGDKDIFGRIYIGYVGSGWIYGEPAPCTAAPVKFGDNRECFATRAR